MNWMEAMMNPHSTALKKTTQQILAERYPKHTKVMDRISHVLVTEEDVRGFISILTDVYEIAYLKAIEDHRKELAKAGLVARIVPPTQ